MDFGDKLAISMVASLWLLGCQNANKAGPFIVLKVERDGHPLFAMVDSSFRNTKLQSGLPWFLNISTALESPTPDGLTTNQEASELNDWEDSLEQNAFDGCRFAFVGRVTWNARRELLYYLDAPDCVSPKIRRFASDHPARKFDFQFERDDHWEKVSTYLAQ